jgi:hypothetical protein
VKRIESILSCLIFAGLAGLHPACAQQWSLTAAPVTNWYAIAASADAKTLAAVVNPNPYNFSTPVPGWPIFVSTNSGATWQVSGAPLTNWIAVAMSADGTRMVGATAVPPMIGGLGGSIFISSNSGRDWAVTSAPATNWVTVASSGDGNVLVAAHGGVGRSAERGLIYTSLNAGLYWQSANSPYLPWCCVASSADGNRLVAAGSNNVGGVVFTSPDSGSSWRSTPLPGYEWDAIAGSADGVRLIALARYQSAYLSSDSGGTWADTGVPVGYGSSAACSADASRLAVATQYGSPEIIRISTNSGGSWFDSNTPATNFASIVFSADGSKLFAAVQGGPIYVWHAENRPVINLSQGGSQLVLSWIVPTADFVLQVTSGLASQPWTDAPAPAIFHPESLRSEVRVLLPTANRFYRLSSR